MFTELRPINGQKSFYGKALVEINDTGKTLFSYGTKILTIRNNGKMARHYDGWTQTTGKHIAAFCGMNKAQFIKLPVAE